MESIYTELVLYGSKNECARTDNVFLPISEVCDGTVSLGDSAFGIGVLPIFFLPPILYPKSPIPNSKNIKHKFKITNW